MNGIICRATSGDRCSLPARDSARKVVRRNGQRRGAAFIAAVLVDLQDSPIDVANLYSGDSSPFGLFSRHGVPKTTFHAMKAFRKLLDTPRRIAATTSDGTTFATCAGINAEQSEISILTSNYRGKDRLLDVSVEKLPWPSRPTWKAFLVDDEHNLEPVEPISVDDSPLRLRFNLARARRSCDPASPFPGRNRNYPRQSEHAPPVELTAQADFRSARFPRAADGNRRRRDRSACARRLSYL